METTAIVSTSMIPSLCSIEAKDRKSAAKVYKALNNPDHRVGDFINKEINIQDVLIEPIEVTNDETGEMNLAPRVVLIDDMGKAYQAVSQGIANSVLLMKKIFGDPTWDEPIPATVRQVSTKRGSMLTLDIDM